MKNAQDLTGDELLDELGIELAPEETGAYTPRQERIIAGFEDILRFHETHGRAPAHGQHLDIFERLYAVRLDQIRKLPEADLALLRPMDSRGLLSSAAPAAEPLDDDDLLRELGGAAESADDIGTLRHVRADDVRRDSPNQVADRIPCKDFAHFRPLITAAQADLDAGRREAKRFVKDASIEQGDFFILAGQMVYVDLIGEPIKAPNGERDARLRAIYSNGTESNILLRSLQRALYKDENGRRLTQVALGPLFGDKLEEHDVVSGTIYVLRSLSQQPEICALHDLHKIGVTTGSVETRIANAERDPTYLLAPVTVAATWKLAGIEPLRIEHIIHRVFGAAQLQLKIPDRFGSFVEPREWFVVPLDVIDEAMQRLQDGTITDVVYDPRSGTLKRL